MYNVTVSHPRKTRYIAEARNNPDRVDNKAMAELLRLNSLPKSYMPLYGLDESLYRATGELSHLGTIVDAETLRGVLPNYVSGLDQPGDWSERHISLFDGHGGDEGDIVGHLRKSLGLIESLRGINSRQPWYDELQDSIALKEMEEIEKALLRYG